MCAKPWGIEGNWGYGVNELGKAGGIRNGAVERRGGSIQGWRAPGEKYLTFGQFPSPWMTVRG